MRLIFTLIGAFIINAIAIAQLNPLKTPTLKIQGYIQDSTSGTPLEKASIHLRKPGSAPLQEVADIKGYFKFENLSKGRFLITVDYVGYLSFSRNINIIDSDTASSISLTLNMVRLSKELQNVIVTVTKSLVENKPDRLIYNVDKDITSQGEVATDVLRKVPQVTVDVNGNVELLGNSSIRFLINGKPSPIFGNNAAEALQSIPASQIQSIEVMSSPGAKYDATGTGGIINIIMRKNRSQGFSGTINTTAGTRLENGSLNLNYKKNNISFSGFFNSSAQLKVKTLNDLIRTSFDTATKNNYYLHQQGNNDFKRNSYRGGLGMDWDITSKDNLSFSVNYNHFGNTNNGFSNQHNLENDKNGNLLNEEMSIRNAYTSFNNKTIDIGADYKRKFKKDKQELSFSFQHSIANNNTNYSQNQQYLSNGAVFSGSSSKNPGKDHLTSISINYSDPVTKDFILETGVKVETETLISDANVFSFSPSTNDYLFDNKQSYASTFRRQVYAAYVSGNFQLFRVLNIMAGLREEHTANKAFYSNSGKANIPAYNNLAPSFTISHTFDQQQMVKFSYSYRLERPEYRDLNPFVNLSDPHNIVTGNPYILPEIGNDFQLGYNQNFGKENNLNIILFFTHNSPDIKSYTTFYPSYKVGDSVYNNVNVTRRSNIASENRYGLNLSGAFTIAGKITIHPGLQLYGREINNIYSIPTKISGFEYRSNLNLNYQITKSFVAEIFGNYRSGLKWQGTQASFYSYSIAMRQQLFKGKGSLGLVAVNAFGKYLTQKTSQQAVGFNAVTELHIPYRSFGINFMYKFGKLKINKPKEAEDLLVKPPVDNQ